MKKNVSVWCALLVVVALQLPSFVHAKRHSRHRGGITAALKTAATSNDSLFVKEDPIRMASLDKLSLTFSERNKEISRNQIDPEEIAPFGGNIPSQTSKDVKNLTKEKDPETIEDFSLRQTLPDQSQNWELPKELQEKAVQHLAHIKEEESEEEKIELQFEDADLLTFVKQIADIFKVSFISDDAIDPLPKGSNDSPARALKGNKISFKTTTPVTKQDAWNLFITFLNISGFGVVQQPDPTIYRIETIRSTQRSPIPTFIGIHYELLPVNDEIVRYLYFVENASLDSIKPIVESLKSASAPAPIWLADQKAFILTDKSYNIRSLMSIVKELDKVTKPQAMSVIKLRQADAEEVKKLYDDLMQSGENNSAFRPFGARRQPTAIFFPESVKIIAEPRTNSLILLGPKDAISKIENFIIKHVDVALDQPYSPLYTYQLQYADAATIAKIMNETTKFGQGTEAGKTGGVRGKDKYLRAMSFTPEPSTNKIVIKGDYDDFLVAKQIIEELDKPQAQVALDVLILSVQLKDAKEIGTQLRSKVPGLDGILGNNVKFATSGLRAGGSPKRIETNTSGSGVDRLLGNLVNLVSQAPAGNTILTFGQDIFGVWGLFQALRTITNVQVVSNPFLFASNKTKAKVSLGETRRVTTSTVIGNSPPQDSKGDDQAALTVNIEPQINSDGMIVLKLKVDLTEFTSTNQDSGTKTTKLVETEAIVADREVLALGGLIRNRTSNSLSKTPVLGDIPVLGWLFKNKQKSVDKDSLLILISTKIIPPNATSDVNEYTKDRLNVYRTTMGDLAGSDGATDPIHRLFFSDKSASSKDLGEFIFDRHQREQKDAASKKRKKRNNTNQENTGIINTTKLTYSGRSSRRKRRNHKVDIAPLVAEPITIAKSHTLTTIAAPSTEINDSAIAQINMKTRRRKSLSSFMKNGESEQIV